MSTAAKAAEANQRALATAGRLQLDTLQELNGALSQNLEQFKTTHEELQADKELIENFIAGIDALVERMNSQIEAMIKLHSEMQEMVRVIYEARER